MKRMLKWLLPALVVAEIALVWGHVLDAGTALLVGGGIELLLLLVVAGEIGLMVRDYRRNRAAGLNVEAAVVEGLSVLLPRPLARFVALEPRVWICLYRWAFRRRPLPAAAFRYNKRSMMGTMLAFAVMVVPVETLAYEFLIPWPLVRWILFLATVYMTLWVVGLYASLQVLPYRLEADGIRLHYGLLAEGCVPYAQIADVIVERAKAPGGQEGLRTVPQRGAAYLAAGGRTDLTLRLHEPVVLQGMIKEAAPARVLYLAADDPVGLAAALRERAGLPRMEPPAPVRSPLRGAAPPPVRFLCSRRATRPHGTLRLMPKWPAPTNRGGANTCGRISAVTAPGSRWSVTRAPCAWATSFTLQAPRRPARTGRSPAPATPTPRPGRPSPTLSVRCSRRART